MPNAAGTFLKNAREEAGLKNKDVVTKLGVGSGWLSEVECGYKHPNGQLEILCEMYGIKVDDVPAFRIQKRPAAKPKAKPSFGTPLEGYAMIAKLARELGDEELVDLAALRIIDAV